MAKATDAQILTLIAQGGERREQGFRLLVESYQERLYWHIRRIVVSHEDAEDVLQESLVNICKNIGAFRGQSSLFTWMFRIATNESLRLFRDRKGEWLPFENVRNSLVNSLYEETGYTGDEIVMRFQEAVLQLPPQQRVVFNMRYYDELPYEEMAMILNSTVENMKTNYHYATKRIKEIMSR
ncbi:MAG: RNA polymerase sigma factor [Rikenellaceae bacterium]|jgi:RNA polymerase sigma-70 factor (ECF subfamily)|nr:RNA polymerase sigma factor [Rikenellaceae bacterium]